jgi:hypothetical protein
MFARSDIYFRLYLLLIIITTTCISLSLCRTSAPIHLTSVLSVLGTQETFCIVIAGLTERDSFDLLLPEFDKPWVIHLRKTCCCSTNLCTWRSNTVYKNRRVRRHQCPVSRSSINWYRADVTGLCAERPGAELIQPDCAPAGPAQGPATPTLRRLGAWFLLQTATSPPEL